MSQGKSSLDSATLMVPAVGFGVMLVLMVGFYIYYRRKQRRHSPVKTQRSDTKPTVSSRSGRRRSQTLAESGGLPPARSSGKEHAS